MNYLLDTHAFIWTILKVSNLSKNYYDIITDRKNNIFVSTISFWEISIKAQIGKLLFREHKINKFPQYAKDMEIKIIDLQETETSTFYDLPLKPNHRDPFDRMLIWQAITKNMTLLSKDEKFAQYREDGLKLVW